METLMIVTHTVQDYDKWKVVFDEDENARQQYGIHIKGVYRSVEHPNEVTIIAEVPDKQAVDKFQNESNLKETMEKAGVISDPIMRLVQLQEGSGSAERIR